MTRPSRKPGRRDFSNPFTQAVLQDRTSVGYSKEHPTVPDVGWDLGAIRSPDTPAGSVIG